MKEITRIVTMEVTQIVQVEDETEVMSREEAKQYIETSMKNYAGYDDVLVTNVQDFVRDLEKGE